MRSTRKRKSKLRLGQGRKPNKTGFRNQQIVFKGQIRICCERGIPEVDCRARFRHGNKHKGENAKYLLLSSMSFRNLAAQEILKVDRQLRSQTHFILLWLITYTGGVKVTENSHVLCPNRAYLIDNEEKRP